MSYIPHGGTGLINRTLPEIEKDKILAGAKILKTYSISNADQSIFYRIADGGLSPLTGPMDEAEFHHVLDHEYVERNGNKYAWTIPIGFSVSKKDAEQFKKGETVTVRNEQNEIIGLLEISDIYNFDKDKYNTSVYGTDRKDHPGARIFNDDPRDMLLGGNIWALPQPKDPNFGQYMLTPADTRVLFEKKGWERVVAFQTRNALHRAVRPHRDRLAALEAEIETLSARKSELDTLLADGAVYEDREAFDQAIEEYADVTPRLEAAEEEWLHRTHEVDRITSEADE